MLACPMHSFTHSLHASCMIRSLNEGMPTDPISVHSPANVHHVFCILPLHAVR